MVASQSGKSSHKIDWRWSLQRPQSGTTLPEIKGNVDSTDVSRCSLIRTKTTTREWYKGLVTRYRLSVVILARPGSRPFAALGATRSRLVCWQHSQDVTTERYGSVVFNS